METHEAVCVGCIVSCCLSVCVCVGLCVHGRYEAPGKVECFRDSMEMDHSKFLKEIGG